MRYYSRGMCGCDCWLFEQSLVCHFRENSTLALFSTFKVFFDFFAHQRQTLDTNFGSEASQTRLGRIRINLKPLSSSQRLWTARVSGAIDDMAGNNACVEVLYEATFRQP